MRNTAFVLWMLFAIPLSSLGDYLAFLARGNVIHVWSPGVEAVSALIQLGAWVFIGVLLYEGKRS